MKAKIMKNDHVPLRFVILGVLIVLLFLLGILYFHIEGTETKHLTLIGGALSGLFCFLILYVLEYSVYRKLDKYKRMGIRNVLENRHEKNYYRPIIESASERVKVMGSSCTRFIEDFLDIESGDKVLVDKLHTENALTVQLLVPDENNMSEERRTRFSLVEDKISKLEGKFKNRFEIKRFPFEARHSFVIVDDILIAGPIFDDEKSKEAPAVEVEMSTQFGKKHLEYFNTTREMCKNNC